MAGGGSRRDDGSLVINNTNGFAALESLRKKKKSDKDSASSARKQKPEIKEMFWATTPLTVKSWADVDGKDDNYYYATTAPPQTVWSSSVADQPVEKESEALVEDDVDTDRGCLVYHGSHKRLIVQLKGLGGQRKLFGIYGELTKAYDEAVKDGCEESVADT